MMILSFPTHHTVVLVEMRQQIVVNVAADVVDEQPCDGFRNAIFRVFDDNLQVLFSQRPDGVHLLVDSR
jgi:hypothetical protein